MNLKGKTAVITGASGGIGHAVARDFSAHGARVVLHGSKTSERLSQLCADIGGTAVVADLRDRDQIIKMFDEIEAIHNTIDVLINSAAIETISDDPLNTTQWGDLFAINLFAAVECCRLALPMMSNGVIVNISSAAGSPHVAYAPASLSYAITKAGIEKVTTQLASMVAPQNRVVGISPGYVLTPIWGDLSDADIKSFSSKVPLGRFIEPEEIAHAVRAVVENDAITGTTIAIDAGLTIHNIE